MKIHESELTTQTNCIQCASNLTADAPFDCGLAPEASVVPDWPLLEIHRSDSVVGNQVA